MLSDASTMHDPPCLTLITTSSVIPGENSFVTWKPDKAKTRSTPPPMNNTANIFGDSMNTTAEYYNRLNEIYVFTIICNTSTITYFILCMRCTLTFELLAQLSNMTSHRFDSNSLFRRFNYRIY